MNCPYCNSEMELGYIDQTDFRFPLEWYPAHREIGLFKTQNRKVRLSYGGSVKAHRFEKCKKIIIDESKGNT